MKAVMTLGSDEQNKITKYPKLLPVDKVLHSFNISFKKGFGISSTFVLIKISYIFMYTIL